MTGKFGSRPGNGRWAVGFEVDCVFCLNGRGGDDCFPMTAQASHGPKCRQRRFHGNRTNQKPKTEIKEEKEMSWRAPLGGNWRGGARGGPRWAGWEGEGEGEKGTRRGRESGPTRGCSSLFYCASHNFFFSASPADSGALWWGAVWLGPGLAQRLFGFSLGSGSRLTLQVPKI